MGQIDDNAERIIEAVDLSYLHGKRILVTGASGLLGRQIASVLDNAGLEDVHLQYGSQMDDEFDPYRTTLYHANLANEADCATLPQADVVIYASSYAQPLRFMAEPLTAMRSSAYGLMAALECCRVGGRFMYVSSSEVYCNAPGVGPFEEARTGYVSPYHPRACYIMAKLWGEAMVNYYRQRGLSTVVVRPGITYGPGFRSGDKRSWAQFVESAVKTGRIHLMDSGLARRTFCYISDGIELLFRILLNGRQQVYNLSGRSSHTIADMARIIGEVSGVPVEIPESGEGVAGTPEDLQLDSTLLDAEFPKREWVATREGMSRTVEWARGNL